MIKKVLIAEFRHESNSFAARKTDLEDFQARYLKEGADIVPFFRGVRNQVGGFIEACEQTGLTMVPAIAANAMPGGPVTQRAFNYVLQEIMNTLHEQEVDGVLLSLHGAMVQEHLPDGEGAILEAVRKCVGSKIPIICTLDLHANVTEQMVTSVDILHGNDCYPHVDSFERGVEAGLQMAALLEGKVKPTMELRQIPILCASLSTFEEPMATYRRLAQEWEQRPGVVCVTFFHGFFYADIADAGMSVVAVTDNDPALAMSITADIGDRIIANRHTFQKSSASLDEAVTRGILSANGPVVLAEASDNPGGGSAGDATHLLKKMIELKVENAGFAIMVDPATVDQAAKAGIGAVIDVRLGGKSELVHGAPIEAQAIVRNVTDGFYRNTGPMDRGLLIDAGQTAVLGIDGIDVIVCKRKLQPIDPEIFRRNGVDPLSKKVLAIKSAVHFRAAYEELAREIIDVDSPGIVSQNLNNFTFRNIRRPIYPLDREP